MTAHQSALVKTAMFFGLVAIVMALGTVWPTFIGYFLLSVFAGATIFVVYMVFLGYDQHKDLSEKE